MEVDEDGRWPGRSQHSRRPSTASGIYSTHNRRRSLVRPERSRSRRRPSRSRTRELGIREHEYHDASLGEDGLEKGIFGKCWPVATRVLTCCIPAWALRKCGRMQDERVQRAWREKVSLCMIVFILCLALGFLTFGFTTIVCRPPAKPVYRISMIDKAMNNKTSRWFLVHGHIFNIPAAYKPYKHKTGDPYVRFAGRDISAYFPYAPSCMSLGVNFKCRAPGSTVEFCHKPSSITGHDHVGEIAYDWEDIYEQKRPTVIKTRDKKGKLMSKLLKTTLFVYNGAVYDLGQYLDQVPEWAKKKPFGEEYDQVLRSVLGRDATRALSRFDARSMACIDEMFRVGVLQVKSIGCITTDIILYVSLVAILSLVLAKFLLAVGFAFSMAHRLGRKGKDGESKDKKQSPATTTTTNRFINSSEMANFRSHSPQVDHDHDQQQQNFVKVLDSTNSDKLYTILLVTCYSEGEVGLRTTLDSLTESSYPDDQKLLLVISDGIITGSGNGRSTPDILVDMMDRSEEHQLFPPYSFDANGQPEAHSYVAIADGTKRHNMARVYAGRYKSGGRVVPMIVVVKCGTPEEASAAKPGNRGKRDSQIILMSFLSKVLFDDRMTPLEFDLFCKIKALMGVTPDCLELVLMVDADTQVDGQAVDKLSCAMRRDPLIMGLCGETQIANATHSWVTAIQVFEYYISHHLSKAFESIFGGVTCLPGCFCMYRIKAPKRTDSINGVQWVPILASPDIVDAYSENITNTLHKKNLLLLGEDRYLTTLMLKTFPKRKMLFVPQALCQTIVPDTFRVLLSQRRRWINSTVHNLFELVLVPDLCGTFCCSMQFVIFMELVGTLVLPAAIVFTGVLITSAFVRKPEWIPLGLLAAILGLPALLILFTTRRPTYIFWFLCYIVALPLWNFVLPVYAFWHFDDFSWGETRKLDVGDGEPGDIKKHDEHGLAFGHFDHSQIVMRRWHEYEQERLAKAERFQASLRALEVR